MSDKRVYGTGRTSRAKYTAQLVVMLEPNTHQKIVSEAAALDVSVGEVARHYLAEGLRRSVSPSDAIIAFMEEMEKRDWSTSVPDIAGAFTAAQARLHMPEDKGASS